MNTPDAEGAKVRASTERTAAPQAALLQALQRNIARVFLGRPEVVRHVVTGLLAGGHVLLEDVPGVGKTVLAKSLARSMDADFRRVQFTPDLLPSDILGVAIYDQGTGAFEFKPGPVFTQILLADEINRATPRTQSALLEAMNDAQVSVDRTSHPLPTPFFVIATQNPYEFEGTYPLPESQLDRFMLRIRIGYPSEADEKQIVRAQQVRHPLDELETVVTADDILGLQATARRVRLEDSVLDYALAVVRETRAEKHLSVGASPRATIALTRAAQAHALVAGRDFVLPDDIKALAVPVLAHRVVGAGLGSEDGRDERERIIRELIDRLEVPI
ncbi:MAG: MoxR family ATPase [Planctomycetota bacterium]|nr:MoxR family ATPase [Planctomycetota bacterium]